jgi:hypothetical protein
VAQQEYAKQVTVQFEIGCRGQPIQLSLKVEDHDFAFDLNGRK